MVRSGLRCLLKNGMSKPHVVFGRGYQVVPFVYIQIRYTGRLGLNDHHFTDRSVPNLPLK